MHILVHMCTVNMYYIYIYIYAHTYICMHARTSKGYTLSPVLQLNK